VGARMREIMEEEEQLRLEISPIYSEIILKHSSYKNPQQDRQVHDLARQLST